MTRCTRTVIANNKGFGGEFKVEEVKWNDGSITYDVYANIGNKKYRYSGLAKIKNAFDKMKRYQMKAMEIALR